MAKASLKKISKMMKDLDYCMLNTVNGRGVPSGRPMSNNHEVEYDGTSYFFTWAKSDMVKEIKKNANVSLSFMGSKLLKKRTFISVTGKASLTNDRAAMEEHWSKDLEIWFKDGLDTKGIMMIEVQAKYLKYWKGSEEGECKI